MTRLFALFTAGLIGILFALGVSAQAPVEEIQVESVPAAPPAQVPAEATSPESAQPAPSAYQAPTEVTAPGSVQAAPQTYQAPTEQSETEQVPTEATQTVNAQGVRYLSGGIGKDEREQLKAAASDYNLKLVFAESNGAFVADVLVTIKNAEGATLLDAKSTGPLFFAKLPAGEYGVQASYRGAIETRSVAVAETGQQALDFRW